MFTMSFIGDLWLSSESLSLAGSKIKVSKDSFVEVLPFLKDSDSVVLNLEGPVGSIGSVRSERSTVIYNSPAIIRCLSKLNNPVAILGNNHICDYGLEGIHKTVKTCERYGVRFVGAGRNLTEACSPLIYQIHDAQIGLLSFTSDVREVGSVIATQKDGGCGSYEDLKHILPILRSVRKKVDILIVSLHWGMEFFEYPHPEQRKLAYLLIDNGVDLIIGHHPHVIQGVEKYRGGLIFYSLGNFFFPAFRNLNGRIQFPKKLSRKSILLKIQIKNKKIVDFSLAWGFVRKDLKIKILNDTPLENCVEYFKRLSENLEIEYYGKMWDEYEKKRKKELRRESIKDAVKKVFRMSPSEIIHSVKIEDVTRNIGRIFGK